jgi:fructokinase
VQIQFYIIKDKAYPGGCPLNSAMAASRLGAPTMLLDRISNDKYGMEIVNKLNEDNISVPHDFLANSRPTMYSKVTLDAHGQAQYLFETQGTATLGLDAKSLEKALESSAKIDAILIGSVSMLLEPAASAILKAMTEYKKSHSQVTILYDPNIRLSLISDPQTCKSRILNNMKIADIIKLSDEDLSFLMNDSTDNAISSLLSFYSCEIILTRGAKGAEWYRRNGKVLSSKANDINVVDTVGAGDTFNGALLYSIYYRNKQIASFTNKECQYTLDLATHAADLNCTRRGCNPPSAEELGL